MRAKALRRFVLVTNSRPGICMNCRSSGVAMVLAATVSRAQLQG